MRFSRTTPPAHHLRTPCLALGALLLGSCSRQAPEISSSAVAQAAPSPPEPDTTPPPGVDLTKLDDLERKIFFRVLNAEASVCGKAHSLAVSIKTDKSCRKSLYAARYVARLVDAGYTDSEIAEHLQKRYRSAPSRPIDIAQAPVKGNASAPITIIEFADYECPHCKRAQPVLRDVLDEFHNDVKLAFKHYPLGQHTNARLAAEAAVAAFKQGKFWPYSDKIWENSDSLTPAVLEKLAKDQGLNVAKWRDDLEGDAKARVDKDRAEGQALGIQSTPTIFINGRLYTDARDVESLRDWINEELGR